MRTNKVPGRRQRSRGLWKRKRGFGIICHLLRGVRGGAGGAAWLAGGCAKIMAGAGERGSPRRRRVSLCGSARHGNDL